MARSTAATTRSQDFVSRCCMCVFILNKPAAPSSRLLFVCEEKSDVRRKQCTADRPVCLVPRFHGAHVHGVANTQAKLIGRRSQLPYVANGSAGWGSSARGGSHTTVVMQHTRRAKRRQVRETKIRERLSVFTAEARGGRAAPRQRSARMIYFPTAFEQTLMGFRMKRAQYSMTLNTLACSGVRFLVLNQGGAILATHGLQRVQLAPNKLTVLRKRGIQNITAWGSTNRTALCGEGAHLSA